jgi:DNA helicase HerA-like ATPase
MKEARKFGISVVVSSQGIADFHPTVLENAGTKLVFRTNYPDSRKVTHLLRGRGTLGDLAKKVEGLHVGQAMVQTPDMPYCATAVMTPG